MEKDKAIIKFNGGNLAMLCSKCKVIIKTGKDFTPEELEFTLGKSKKVLPRQFCEQCKTNHYVTSPTP
jgi:hypothetical protein